MVQNMPSYKVTSEIYKENKYSDQAIGGNNRISKFIFKHPPFLIKQLFEKQKPRYDKDGDLIVEREKEGTLSIEHCTSTELKLVGLQLWRGAFLLADFILANPDLFKDKTILELGSGVGLTSIIASSVAKKVICTDVNIGDILKLIARNFENNKQYVKCKVNIAEVNFLNLKWAKELCKDFKTVDIILAADVIYDDSITEGFVKTLGKLLDPKPSTIAYVALEKRFVFTISDLDSVAPMYEEFLRCVARNNFNWTIEEIKLDFPKYFQYERLKQMLLMKIKRAP
ncbi:methyltransferase-like protein 22 isoform X2 [Belonocnema kinseyi]|uniref:methyltransferase-like protein 22 isoform X2 n=1 Tax=Belonocnema kinseyi TaxID=2817044 RepID=UPI00143D82DF|nr:methyltransferase-like protein 22 isoform X2 [Belonocnema kinseyi]